MTANNKTAGIRRPEKEAFILDPLTGFFEQSYLNQRLQLCVDQRQSPKVSASLALLQLENFYEIRRWLGKSEATLLLSDIAKILKKSLPQSVVLCRCDHYEFAVLLTGETSPEARAITQQIRSTVESAAAKSLPGKLALKIGIGIAQLDQLTASIDVLYARARHDMTIVKQSLRTNHKQDKYHTPQALFSRLQKCLKEKSLMLNFQAVVNLKTDDIEHYEIRTSAQDHIGKIPAQLLFEVAVQNAWGEAIDRWIIINALKLLRGSKNLTLTLTVTHNSIVSTEFFAWLLNALAGQNSLGSRLIFQISEIDVLIAQHHMGYVCHQLNKLDISLCINHFGCTDDPFRYLGLLRADFVKLDPAILEKHQGNNPDTMSLAELIEKLHENGLRVITGKIDNINNLPHLWRSNVNYVQGHCFHQPSNKLDFEFTEEQTLSVH